MINLISIKYYDVATYTNLNLLVKNFNTFFPQVSNLICWPNLVQVSYITYKLNLTTAHFFLRIIRTSFSGDLLTLQNYTSRRQEQNISICYWVLFHSMRNEQINKMDNLIEIKEYSIQQSQREEIKNQNI